MPPHAKKRQSVSRSDRVIAAHRNWREFWQELLSHDRGTQADVFERLTQLYLQTQPEYVSKLRHVWRSRKQREGLELASILQFWMKRIEPSARHRRRSRRCYTMIQLLSDAVSS
jgi:hypothetical protein